MASRALSTLVTGLFDYAGLYPPAKLAMQAAAEHYARARMGEHDWMLGRLVCPASKLHKLSEAAAVLMPGTHATSGYREHADVLDPWSISAVIDVELEEAIELIDAFDEHHGDEDHGLARVDAIELRAPTPGFIDEALELIPDDMTPYFEVPAEGDCRGFIAALAGNEASGKIRCGGVTPDAIPPSAEIAEFLLACRGAGVPFKATAGLHHPIRAEQRLTYEESSPRGTMHGFVNLFMACAFVRAREASREMVIDVLEERDAGAFRFDESGAAWRGHRVDIVDIARMRETFAISIGSCSFDEPVGGPAEAGVVVMCSVQVRDGPLPARPGGAAGRCQGRGAAAGGTSPWCAGMTHPAPEERRDSSNSPRPLRGRVTPGDTYQGLGRKRPAPLATIRRSSGAKPSHFNGR
ncbi:MAG: hypothetical protein IPJ41_04875 [Phycisphaerales bacterium]|nr:hypothetical protein [Phycisphaerales bacterium]